MAFGIAGTAIVEALELELQASVAQAQPSGFFGQGAVKPGSTDVVLDNLDTKSGELVIDLLGARHRDLAITLVLVTHDEWVAERAERVLRVADGRLVGDTAADHDSAGAR